MPCYEDIIVCAAVSFERNLIINEVNVIRVSAETSKPLGQNARPYRPGHPDTRSWKRSTRAAKQYLRHA